MEVCVCAEGGTLQDICTWMRPVLWGEVGTPRRQLAADNKGAWTRFFFNSTAYASGTGGGRSQRASVKAPGIMTSDIQRTKKPLRHPALPGRQRVDGGNGKRKNNWLPFLSARDADCVLLPLWMQSCKHAPSPGVHNHYHNLWAMDKAESQMRQTGCNVLCNL